MHEAHALARPRESAHYLLRVEGQVVAVEGHLEVGAPPLLEHGGADHAHGGGEQAALVLGQAVAGDAALAVDLIHELAREHAP